MTVVAAEHRSSHDSSPPAGRWPGLLLVAVCIAHGLSSLLLAGYRQGLGWDETIYLSQYNRVVPLGFFNAPRARGVPVLVAPLTLITPSTVAVRLYLAVVSSALLYVGFRPWRHLVAPYAVPLAAALFSSLWITMFYGEQAIPNLFVALLAVPAAALIPLYLRDHRRARLAWLVVCLTFVALLRPSDGLYLGAALGLVALLAPGHAWRVRVPPVAAVAAGFAVGAGQWVVEAYLRFGGPVTRYHAALAAQGGSGLHNSLPQYARTLAGPLLCRQGCHPHTPVEAMLWWFLLPPLVAVGIALARPRERLALVTATTAALVSAVQYIVGIGYAAPRFLLPTYALLALPCAAALVELVRRLPVPARRPGVAVLVVLVLAQVVSQALILRIDLMPPARRQVQEYTDEANSLDRHLLHGRFCAVSGRRAPPVAYRLRCRSVEPAQLAGVAVPPGTVRVFLSGAATPPRLLRGWTRTRLPLPRHRHMYVYTPPPARA